VLRHSSFVIDQASLLGVVIGLSRAFDNS